MSHEAISIAIPPVLRDQIAEAATASQIPHDDQRHYRPYRAVDQRPCGTVGESDQSGTGAAGFQGAAHPGAALEGPDAGWASGSPSLHPAPLRTWLRGQQ